MEGLVVDTLTTRTSLSGRVDVSQRSVSWSAFIRVRSTLSTMTGLSATSPHSGSSLVSHSPLYQLWQTIPARWYLNHTSFSDIGLVVCTTCYLLRVLLWHFELMTDVLVYSKQRHQLLANVIGACVDTRQPYVIVEFVDGQSLRDVIRRSAGDYSWVQRVRVASYNSSIIAVLAAVAAAAAAVVHVVVVVVRACCCCCYCCCCCSCYLRASYAKQ